MIRILSNCNSLKSISITNYYFSTQSNDKNSQKTFKKPYQLNQLQRRIANQNKRLQKILNQKIFEANQKNIILSNFIFSKQKLQKLKKSKWYSRNKEEPKKQQKQQTKKITSQISRQKMLRLMIIYNLAFFLYFYGQYFEIKPSKPNKTQRNVMTENELFDTIIKNSNIQKISIIRTQQRSFLTNQIPNNNKTTCIVIQNKNSIPIAGCQIQNEKNFLQKLQLINPNIPVQFSYNALKPPSKPNYIGKIVMGCIIFGFIYLLRKNSFTMNRNIKDLFQNKKYQPVKQQQINTYFKDVAGMHEAKIQVTQFVDFLKNPDRYIQMGAKIPKGALLTGPPGTGKTLLARACAGQAGVPFFYVSGSQFVEKYVGMGANRVRKLFEQAQKVAPSIIFIDQIDAIGKKRATGPFANQQRQNTLNQILVNMDGFQSKGNKVIVLAATNLKDALDPALLRPGRFDRAVEITLPNFQERVQILKVHLQKIKFTKKFNIDEIAKKISILTPGFSGAQLANICNEAAILAARVDKQFIEIQDFQKATERVMAGLEKRNQYSAQQKQCLAYYQCGKVVANWFTNDADPIIKVSIAPYSKTGMGYSHEIKDQMPLKTYTQLINKAICSLAGRLSQLNFKGYNTSNGDKDLKRAKRIITFMVTKFGMSNKIGTIGFPDIEYVRKPYSQQTQTIIDQQIQRIYKICEQTAKQLILQKSQHIQKLKNAILQKQTLTHSQIVQILGNRPQGQHDNYNKFLSDLVKTNDEVAKEETVKTK